MKKGGIKRQTALNEDIIDCILKTGKHQVSVCKGDHMYSLTGLSVPLPRSSGGECWTDGWFYILQS